MKKRVVLNNGDIVNIVTATPQESEKIVEYMNKVGGESDFLTFGDNDFNVTPQQQEEFLQTINEHSFVQIFLVKLEGEIIAIGEVQMMPRLRTMHNCLLSISVKKEKWGAGLGSILLQFLIEYLKSKQIIKNILLEVRCDNKRAISLYKKFGFIKIGVKSEYIKIKNNFFDVDYMQLKI